jgi:hypothetical protein
MQIGTSVHVAILSQGRAEYGKQIVAALGRQFGLDALKGSASDSR